MLQQQTEASASGRSRELAEMATVRALLNSYIRETGELDLLNIKQELRNPLPEHGERMIIRLPATGKTITGKLTYFSAMGQHVYGPFFDEVLADGIHSRLDTQRLTELLLDELSRCVTPDKRDANLHVMRSRIHNSLHKMSMYIEFEEGNRQTKTAKKLDFVRSEQSLYLGHPFHPYPKCSEGFADTDLAYYSPEMSASFQLYYIAVRKEYVHEAWVDGEDQHLAPSVLAYAKQQLGDQNDGYRVLPMHPWQAKIMLGEPAIQELVKQSAIIQLGAIGPAVYPTSSVRTVWDPEGGYGYKLSLHVRITNLLRVNTKEQAVRTLDAARVIHRLQDGANTDRFKILAETGFSRISFDSIPEHMASDFTVIYRPMNVPQSRTFVVASLLESRPGDDEPKLIQAIRQSNQGKVPDLSGWLKCYLQISMLPLLHLLAAWGVSFEAHLQNSLVSIKNGLPDCFYVRDLEGVSIDRRKASEAGWLNTLIPDSSPVLYEEREVWMRTQYYFFVNHLGSLIHTIAAYKQEDEERYWRIAKHMLEQERRAADDRLIAYMDELLSCSHFPAKANFVSCFQSKGETPSYVRVPNPMNGSGAAQA